jgi:putative ABC transport system ATP-binding protein
MPVLQAHELYRFYHAGEEETLALRGVSLQVEAGEAVAVMGPSGSGKSTLLACLAGLDEPDGGYVEVHGRRLTRRPEAVRSAFRARYIGVMLQAGNLLSQLTVEDNLLVPMLLARRVDRKRISELLELVGLGTRRNAWPAQLSGGEEARAGLAVALATNPPVLLADEPTGQVDVETEKDVMRLIADYCKAGGAALLVTHSDAIARYANRIIRLSDGRVVDDA